MCLYPRLIRNQKFTANKKNGGNIPAINDNRTLYVPVGCGYCIECARKRSREWKVRLLEDIKTHRNGKFVTLTFSNESYAELAADYPQIDGYTLDNQIATLAVRRFLERWRKNFKKSLRHWLVTELGHNGTERIHLHGIVWTDQDPEIIEKYWKYGWVWKYKMERGKKVNYVNDQTIGYITKYVTKQDLQHKNYKPIVLTSPGIGGNYTLKQKGDWTKNIYNGDNTDETYRTKSGHKLSLPIYWRNKIYTDEQKEQLWIQKLNKQERYVLGKRIDVSKGMGEYWAALDWHRKLNRELGYGSYEKDWKQAEYEETLRKLKRE